jgi:DNA repair exonuclease SbcCD ATPase subunit
MKGLNRFAWNFKGENISPDIQGAYVYGDYTGYRLSPGKYKAKITYKDASSETEMNVIQDPSLKVTAADWNEQQKFLNNITSEVSEIHKSIIAMRKVKKQVETFNDLLKDVKDSKELVEKGKDLIKKIDEWEASLIETRQKNFQDVINFSSKLNVEFLYLKNLADAHDPRVTEGLKSRNADLDKEWVKYKSVYDKDLRKAIDNYNALFKNKNLPAIIWEIGVQ